MSMSGQFLHARALLEFLVTQRHLRQILKPCMREHVCSFYISHLSAMWY
jgi:hypothetical protein